MKDHHLNRGKRELPAAVRVVSNTTHGIMQKTSSPNLGSVSQHRQTVQTQQSPGVTTTTSQAKNSHISKQKETNVLWWNPISKTSSQQKQECHITKDLS